MSGEFDDILGDYSNEKEQDWVDIPVEEEYEVKGSLKKLSEAYERIKAREKPRAPGGKFLE